MRSSRRAASSIAAIVVVGLFAVGCGGDGDGASSAAETPSTIDPAAVTTTTTAGPVDGALPPAGALDLDPLYGEQLAAVGMHLTDRGGLIDRTDGGYQASAEGRHLALYVEPIEDRTMEEYIEGIRTVTAILAGDVFERWPGLESFDVCQEPTTADDPQPEPLPVTQIELTRQEAAAIDWATVTVAELVRASEADPPGLALRVSAAVSADPGFQDL